MGMRKLVGKYQVAVKILLQARIVTTEVRLAMKPVAKPDHKVSPLAKSLPHQASEEAQSEYLGSYLRGEGDICLGLCAFTHDSLQTTQHHKRN